MKTIKKLVVLSAFLIGILVLNYSCKDYLDIKPYGRAIPKTVEEFSALLHNYLNKIDAGTDKLLVGNASQILVWDAQCGDDFETCLTSGSGSISLGNYVGDIIGSSTTTYYETLYAVIRDCNIVLNNLQEKDTELAHQVLGTAHAMRGVAYYQLLRFFCETPQSGSFNTQKGLALVTVFDMEEKAPRSSMQATIDLIEKDFKQSMSYKVSNPVYLFTEDVVKGYLTRLYFWTKQWEKAYPLAKELVTKYPLVEGENYKKMMTDSYKLTGNQLLKSHRSLSASGSSLSAINTTLQIRPVSKRFLDSFYGTEKETDIRYNMWINKKREAIKVFFCGMRAAEFKLIEAECAYHLGTQDKALQAINELRAHRIENYTYLKMHELPEIQKSEIIKQDATGKPLTQLMALILKERRKELFLEGDRFFEQKRNGTPEYWIAYNGRKYEAKSFMYTFPIPYRDINLVKEGLEQNPGYEELITD